MTDRIHTLTVVLKEDTREDDVETLISAIRCFTNALSVKTHVTDFVANMAEDRARQYYGSKLWEVIHPKVRP